ncbi:dTDP-4-dehydrorhamnose reductase [Streptomyces sp. TG1A-60]|uniref:dTDP-4-dehydrorhamnose reductase n=1 Tax=unclassified Streptomyces TaxID=2593676 RepID=UPI0011EC01EC|nr:dTDP-4-dehydrorhamnose reductase [Streptomyces sp. TRM49041]
MRWLVTGARGMLGQEIVHRLRHDGDSVAATTRHRLDITDAKAVRRACADTRPDIVVNCAAWTAVDQAESNEDDAYRVNADGARHLAEACAALDARLIHISTDYVFPGDSAWPYDEADEPAPRTAYGRTKLAGERAVLSTLPDASAVVRTAWLYGAHGANFLRTMARLEREQAAVDVVADQHGQPTWAGDVADRVIALGRNTHSTGIFHATSRGQTTWFALAQEVFRLLGADPARVRATTSRAFPTAAPRPAYSVLAHNRWKEVGIAPIRPWRDALSVAFAETLGGRRWA